MIRNTIDLFRNIKPLAYPGRHRLGVGVYFFVSGFNFATFASRIPDLQKILQLNESQLGSLLFVIPLGLLASLLVTAWLITRFHSRYIMFTGAIIFIACIGLLGKVTEVWHAVVLFFIFGASRSLFNVSANAQAVDVQALYTKSVLTTFHGIWSLAAFGGAVFGWLMISQQVDTFHHFAGVGLFNLLLVLVAFRYSLHNDVQDNGASKQSFVWPNKSLLRLGLIAFGSMLCEGTMSEWSGIYFNEIVHASRAYITSGYVAYLTTMTIGRFAGDWLIGKTGKKRMLQASGMLIAFGITLAVALPYPVTAAMGFGLTGLGVCCIIPLVFGATAKVSTMASGPAIASVSTIGYIGFLAGPPVIGYIAHTFSLQWSFSLLILIGIAITFLVSTIKLE